MLPTGIVKSKGGGYKLRETGLNMPDIENLIKGTDYDILSSTST